MKFVLIVVWFGFPQQQQYPDFSSMAWRPEELESRRNADRSLTTWPAAGANVHSTTTPRTIA